MNDLIKKLIDTDDAVGIEKALAEGLSPNTPVDQSGENLLARAAARGSENVAQILLSRGADPDGDGLWPAPLVLAIEAGNIKIVEMLLAAGADLGTQPWHEDADLPLVSAFFSGELEIAEMLISHDAVELADERWFEEIAKQALRKVKGPQHHHILTALFSRIVRRFEGQAIPVSKARLLKVASLLDQDDRARDLTQSLQSRIEITAAAIDRVWDWAEDVAEETATADSLVEIVQEAPESVRPQVAALAFREALGLAEVSGFEHLAEEIFSLGIDVDYSEDGRTPLMEAALHGQASFVRRLIEMGADVRAADLRPQSCYSVVEFARNSGDVETISVIEAELRATSSEYDRRTDLELQQIDLENRTAVLTALAIEAATEDRWDRVRDLIAKGADVNGRGRCDRVLIMEAASRKRWDHVEELIRHGADINSRDRNGNTLLVEAVRQRDRARFSWLIEHGATIDDKTLPRLLMWARTADSDGSMRRLIQSHVAR